MKKSKSGKNDDKDADANNAESNKPGVSLKDSLPDQSAETSFNDHVKVGNNANNGAVQESSPIPKIGVHLPEEKESTAASATAGENNSGKLLSSVRVSLSLILSLVVVVPGIGYFLKNFMRRIRIVLVLYIIPSDSNSENYLCSLLLLICACPQSLYCDLNSLLSLGDMLFLTFEYTVRDFTYTFVMCYHEALLNRLFFTSLFSQMNYLVQVETTILTLVLFSLTLF